MNAPEITLRNEIQPGDLGYIIYLHGFLIAKKYNFDHTFETDVALAVTDFFRSKYDQERIWIAEHKEMIIGTISIVKHSDCEAQLRWFLLHPHYRGFHFGKKLILEAISFCKNNGYSSIFLWTIDLLFEATNLYKSVGFTITEEQIHSRWGRVLKEQRYDLKL